MSSKVIIKQTLNAPYKIEFSYDINGHALFGKQSYLFFKKDNSYKIDIQDSHWLSMYHYENDQVGPESSPDVGKCVLSSNNDYGQILFKGSPEMALKITNYLIKMTGLCAVQKRWLGNKLKSCEILNKGNKENCLFPQNDT